MKELSSLKQYATSLPDSPGVYRFYDDNAILIYVGKAKSLKNRVSSYFSGQLSNRKTYKLVEQIYSIEFTLVNNEYDALLLENSLIKEHQPKYNIRLRDDKNFPYICVTDEPFPKLIVTRQPDTSRGTLYGPYTNVKIMHSVLELIRQLYPIRTCSLLLNKENIEAKKFKVCLEYHIGNCKGPCENLQSEADYSKNITMVHHILKGNVFQVQHHFKEQMKQQAAALEFEKAEETKQKLLKLDSFQNKSQVVNPNIRDTEVISIVSDENFAYLNYLKIKNGAIIHTENIHIKKKLEEQDEDILALVMVDVREKVKSESQEIISNKTIPIELDHLHILIPKIGDKKKLLDLSLKNAFFFKKEQEKKKIMESTGDQPRQAVLELQKVLHLPQPPLQIECFDNSNLQGTSPVASMVFFKNGKALKKEYRHFNIKTVTGPDDFASMQEIVFRRYKRQLEEKKALPDLIIIDGGKGQLSAACEALKRLDLYGKNLDGKMIRIIGIAKRLEEIYFPEDEIPVHINKKSLALKLIQQIRDEAHRFAITFHRNKRDKKTLDSELMKIKGVGEKTFQILLQQFKTIKNIKQQSTEELANWIGKAKAEIVKKHFESK